MSQSDPVIMCLITTDAPTTPTLHTCFQFAGDRVSRGGWQLSTLDSCNALRFDGLDRRARRHARPRALPRHTEPLERSQGAARAGRCGCARTVQTSLLGEQR